MLRKAVDKARASAKRKSKLVPFQITVRFFEGGALLPLEALTRHLAGAVPSPAFFSEEPWFSLVSR